jgi:hypothetical protein
LLQRGHCEDLPLLTRYLSSFAGISGRAAFASDAIAFIQSLNLGPVSEVRNKIAKVCDVDCSAERQGKPALGVGSIQF